MNFLCGSVVYNSPQAFIQIFKPHAVYKHVLVFCAFLVVSFSLPWISYETPKDIVKFIPLSHE